MDASFSSRLSSAEPLSLFFSTENIKFNGMLIEEWLPACFILSVAHFGIPSTGVTFCPCGSTKSLCDADETRWLWFWIEPERVLTSLSSGALLQQPGWRGKTRAEALQQPAQTGEPGPGKCPSVSRDDDGSHLRTGRSDHHHSDLLKYEFKRS